MMKLSKKILAIALAVIMVLSVLPFSAFATEYEAGSMIDGSSLQTGDKIYLEGTNIHALFGGAVLKAGQFLEFSSYKACQGGNKANGTVTSSDIYLSDNMGISDYYFKYVEDYESGKCYVPIDKNGNVLEYILVLEKTDDFEPITFGTYVATVTSVAEVNGTQYATLEEAIAAANAGDTVKLLADIDFTVYPAFTRHTLDLTGVTLDLDGHTITGYNHSVVYVGDNFTIKNGNMVCVYDSVNNKKESYAAVIYPQEGNWQTDVVTDKSTGVVLENLVLTGGINCFGADVTVRGENTKVTGNYYYALWADVLATLTVEDGTFTSAASSTNGIIGACSDAGKEAYVYISGGDYTVPAGKNLVLQSTMASSQQLVEISGGTYNVVVPAKACAEGFVPVTEPDAQGKYTVAVDTAVAEVNGVKYESFDEALRAISTVNAKGQFLANGTLRLLADCAGNGYSIASGSNLIIDFNGKTYTVDAEPLAGSTGTKTQAFQLLKNSTVIFKNGTLYSEVAKMLVQNYSDLTLEGMRLTLENPNYYPSYTLSNNNGDTMIIDSTINANSKGGFAFDVCRYASYPSVSVTVAGDSEINGDVEISASKGDPKEGLSLKLNGGTMSGEIVLDSTVQDIIENENVEVKKAAAFTKEAPEGFKWDENGILVEDVVEASNGSSLTLTDGVKFNAYIDADAYGVDADTAVVKLTYNHNADVSKTKAFSTDTIALTDATKYVKAGDPYDGTYKFAFAVAPAQYAEDITIELYATADAETPLFTTTTNVKSMCEKVIALAETESAYAAYANLCKALADYCQAAQVFFSYDAPAAPAYYNEAVTTLAAADMEVPTAAVGIEAAGFSFTIVSALEVNVFYNGDLEIQNVSIDSTKGADAVNAETTTKSGRNCINITGIASGNLDNVITVNTSAGVVELSATNIAKAIAGSTNTNYANLARALYLYSVQASAFFGA